MFPSEACQAIENIQHAIESGLQLLFELLRMVLTEVQLTNVSKLSANAAPPKWNDLIGISLWDLPSRRRYSAIQQGMQCIVGL